ncbi:ABC transporter permease [Peterkaempfera sp. SMS 1(5)a]|uniref:ABC transporter permease n=1 Tax=Peterkaempfera podocarpi TaxID=3232308 RepID=UPI00366CA5F1
MIIRLFRGKAMKKPSTGLRSWHRTVIATVVLPLVISLAVTAYAWPASRIAPRDLPVGIVGTSTASQSAVEGLTQSMPGGFDFHLYPDQSSARSAIKNREVYGAFVVTPGHVTVLEASAASASVAQLLTMSGQHLAAQAAKLQVEHVTPSADSSSRSTDPKDGGAEAAVNVRVKTVDIAPFSANDPRGVVFSSALLPLTICSIAIAALIALSGGRIPMWRRLIDLFAACAVTGLAAYLIAQGLLGALPHEHVATWAALSLTMLAISATSVGLITLVGPAGLGLSAVLMVFVGNPFSGITSAPELLPKAVEDIGQWLPPGAGANLLRSTAYFDGNGSAGHIAVLVLWSVLGLATAVLARRTPTVASDTVASDTVASDTVGEDLPGSDDMSADSPVVDETATALSPSPTHHRQAHARHAAHE